MSSDVKEELALKVIQFIEPEAEPLHSRYQCVVKLPTIKPYTISTHVLIECYAADAKKKIL